jgi:hypothetical protein
MIDLPQVAHAYADMEKRCSDSFHYYHFLRTAKDAERKAAAVPTELPEAPGLPVIVHSASEPPRGLKRSWQRLRGRFSGATRPVDTAS